MDLLSEFSLVGAFLLGLLNALEVDFTLALGSVQEVIISVPTNEVDSTSGENNIQRAADVAVVEAFQKAFTLTGSSKLIELLMFTFLGGFHPGSELGKSILGVEVRLLLHNVIVGVGEQLGDLFVGLTTAVDRAQSGGQDGHLSDALGLTEGNEFLTELLLRGNSSTESEEHFRGLLGVLPELGRHRDSAHWASGEGKSVVDDHR